MKSVSSANILEERIGWRVFAPSKEEVFASIGSGLQVDSGGDVLPMYCMLPLNFPVDREDPRVSGPLWIGPTGDREAMSSMSEERALESCGPAFISDDPVGWSQKRYEAERRKVTKSVRHLAEESQVIDSSNLVVVDDLAAWLGTGAPLVQERLLRHLGRSVNWPRFPVMESHLSGPRLRGMLWSRSLCRFNRRCRTSLPWAGRLRLRSAPHCICLSWLTILLRPNEIDPQFLCQT